jgi:hypothetical protein
MQTLYLNMLQSVSEPLMATALSGNHEVELLEKKAVPSKLKSDSSESAVLSAASLPPHLHSPNECEGLGWMTQTWMGGRDLDE